MFRIFGLRNSICGHMSSRLRLTGVPFKISFHRTILPTSSKRRVRFASAFLIFSDSSTTTNGSRLCSTAP